jgi:DNA-binding NarL/FixJ family response regulator
MRSGGVSMSQRVNAGIFTSGNLTTDCYDSTYESASIPRTEAEHHKGISSLTDSEREILKLTALGMKDRHIATRLRLRETAVANSLQSVSRKLACQDRLELIVFAYWQGLA